jgi:hypothetical protein
MIITSSVVVNTYWLTSNLEVQNELYLGMAKLPCSLGGGGGEPNIQKNHAHTTPIILHLIKAGISFMYHYLPLRNLYGINIELWHLVNANQSILNFKWLHKFWEVLICWPSPLSCRHLSRTIVWRHARPFDKCLVSVLLNENITNERVKSWACMLIVQWTLGHFLGFSDFMSNNLSNALGERCEMNNIQYPWTL